MNSTADFAPIADLDFSAITAKLMHPSGKGWSAERTRATEREYRRFLLLMKKFPNEPTAPLVDVDTFWHYHILDTMKYAQDCQQVFGYFLHHFPYVGMRGVEDAAALQRMGKRMRTIYEATFGEAYPGSEPDRHVGSGIALTARVPQAPAFCGAAATAEPAFCGAAVTAEPAFCGAAVTAEAAFCGAAATAEPAFCGAAVSAEPAFCGAAVSAQAAFCGAATTAAGREAADPGKQQTEYKAGFYASRPTLG